MNLLFQGSLAETLTLKDMLVKILQAENSGLSLLELKRPKDNEEGELYFLGGHYIVSAKLNNTSGEEALNQLLKLSTADFFYYACGPSESITTDNPLKINLKELIENWPSEKPKPLSENELLDKIFNTGAVPVLNLETEQQDVKEAEVPQLPPTDTSTKLNIIEPKTESKQNAEPNQNFTTGQPIDLNWDLFEPLLSGNTNNDDDLHSTQGLRALSSAREKRRQIWNIFLLIFFLAGLIVIICTLWFTVNAPSSQVSPRRYSFSPAQKHNNNDTLPANYLKH